MIFIIEFAMHGHLSYLIDLMIFPNQSLLCAVSNVQMTRQSCVVAFKIRRQGKN